MTILAEYSIQAYIDHTRLFFSPDDDQNALIRQLCAEACQYQFYAVCVRPEHVTLAKSSLQGSSVQVASVIGFPTQKTTLAAEATIPTIGHIPFQQKLEEITQATADGADELDYVIDVATFKTELHQSGQTQNLEKELTRVYTAACGRPVKVILETDLLNPKELQAAIRAAAKARQNPEQLIMVKTSTGAITDGVGASPEITEIMARIIHDQALPLRIKASGGIKTLEHAQQLLGSTTSLRLVSRLGTSSGIEITQAQNPEIKPVK